MGVQPVHPPHRVAARIVAVVGDEIRLVTATGEQIADIDVRWQTDVGSADAPSRYRLTIQRERHQQVFRGADRRFGRLWAPRGGSSVMPLRPRTPTHPP